MQLNRWMILLPSSTSDGQNRYDTFFVRFSSYNSDIEISYEYIQVKKKQLIEINK